YSYFTLRSMGPDGRDQTADDISFQVYAQRKPQTNANRYSQFKGRTSVHEGDVAGGRVAVDGVVKDQSGKPISGVKVSARRLANGMTRSVYTDATGRFTIPNLAPGNHQVIFESEFYQSTVSRTLSLEAGARGVVDAVLERRDATPMLLSVYPDYRRMRNNLGEFAEFDRAGGLREEFAMRKDGRGREMMQVVAGAAMPMPEPAPPKSAVPANGRDENNAVGAEPRVRSFFPETLYTNPSLITDGQGRASIHVPM